MFLMIENCDDRSFIKYLVREIKLYGRLHIKSKKLILIDEYLNTLPILKTNPQIKKALRHISKTRRVSKRSKTNRRRSHQMEAYINKLIHTDKKSRRIRSIDIIRMGLNNLQIVRHGESFTIQINPNKKIYGTDAKLCDICKLINYGT